MTNTKQYYHLMFKNYPDLLNVDELIDVLKISKKTVYKLLKDNKIKHIKTGREYRIPKVYVIDYLLAS